MNAQGTLRDLTVLGNGMRAGASFGLRIRVAVSILLSLLLLGSLLPVTVFDAPHRAYVPVLVAIVGLLLGAVWTVTAGAVTRAVALGIAGRPESPTRSFGETFGRIRPLVGAPGLALCGTGLLLGVLLLLVQSARVPALGPVLFVLLLPVTLAVSWGAASILVRWLLSGHLSGTAVSVDGLSAFVGLSRGFSYLRSAPLTVVGLRALAQLAVIGRGATEALVLGFPVLALVLSGVDLPGRVDAGIEAMWRARPGAADIGVTSAAVLVVCWFLSAPVSAAFGGRAALYLIHRRAFDGVPLDAPREDAEPEKTLEELGVELVERLRDRDGEES